MQYYIYVLRSQKDGVRYIGRSSILPGKRVIQHNRNKGRFTRGHQPWELLYQEEYKTMAEASRRERFLKSGQGRKFLDSISSHSGIV